MGLKLLSDDGRVLRLEVSGDVIQDCSTQPMPPVHEVAGDGCYSRQALMGLEETEYIDSSGLSWILCSHKRFQAAGGKLVIHSIPVRVEEVLRVMRLDQVLHLAADEAAAQNLIDSGGAQ